MKRKKKLLNTRITHTLAFIITSFPPEVSGTSLGNWERIQWFAKQGVYRVVVFVPDWQNRTVSLPVPSDLCENFIIERYPSKPWFVYNLNHVPRLFAARQISKNLAQYQPNLIILADVERVFFFSTWQLPGRQYARQNNIRYIAHYHTDFYNFALAYPRWRWSRNVFLRPLTKQLYSQLDGTICSTSNARKSLENMGLSNVKAIEFVGIDVSNYSPARRSRKWLEPWLKIEEKNNVVILFLGRLGPEKRVDLLIKAFAKLKLSNQYKYSLLIAGDGPLDSVRQLKILAQGIPDIHFTGFLHGETKANVLASCDVFCLPSPYETFGRVVVEAMASGIPVVAVNSGAVPDYLIDRVNGYLVPANSVEELTNGLQTALSSNNVEIVRNALQSVQHFSVELGCQRLNHYYQEILKLQQFNQLNDRGNRDESNLAENCARTNMLGTLYDES